MPSDVTTKAGAEELHSARRDGRDLRRAVFVNTLGNALKLALPLLLAVATNTFGVTRWGIYVSTQTVAMVVVRVGLLGLDKATLWWTAGRDRERGARSVRGALFAVALSSSVVGLVVGALGPLAFRAVVSKSVASPEQLAAQTQALRIMLLGLIPFSLTDVLLCAAMGQGRMEPQVWIRDTFVPVATIALSVLFFHAGLQEFGLAWGFTAAQALALPLAWLAYRRIYPAPGRPRELPPELLKYAWPIWLNEMVNSFLLRVDILVLGLFVDASLVGVWGIVTQFGNSMRTIRRAFDPIVTALSARIAAQHDPARLREAYSYATQLVSLTQFPVFVAMLVFGDLVLPLYGPGYDVGVVPLAVLSAFWLLNGASGLAGIVVAGYGKSRLTLLNTLVGLAAQGLLLWVLVPRYGLLGAALSVGGAYSLQNALQLVQMRIVTGSTNYARRVLQPLGPAAAGLALGAVTFGLAVKLGQGTGTWLVRGGAFASFCVAYGAVTWLDYRAGKLASAGT